MVGIAVASALLFLIGTGPLQTGLLVALAMTAALLLRGGDTLVGEAAVSAILLASLSRPTPASPPIASFEGLIGGGVGLVIASLLLPPDPVLMVNRVAQSVVGKLGHTLQETAGALADGDSGRAEQALRSARAIDDEVEALEDIIPAATETARFSPVHRGDREVLRRYEETMPQVDFAVRNARVLTRYVLRHTRGSEPTPAGLPLASRSSPTRCGELGAQYDEPARATELRPLAISAARHAGRSYDSPELTQIAGQVRSVAVDLVRASEQLGEPEPLAWDLPTEELLVPRLERAAEDGDRLRERRVGHGRVVALADVAAEGVLGVVLAPRVAGPGGVEPGADGLAPGLRGVRVERAPHGQQLAPDLAARGRASRRRGPCRARRRAARSGTSTRSRGRAGRRRRGRRGGRPCSGPRRRRRARALAQPGRARRDVLVEVRHRASRRRRACPRPLPSSSNPSTVPAGSSRW